jgi:hypothetical protein
MYTLFPLYALLLLLQIVNMVVKTKKEGAGRISKQLIDYQTIKNKTAFWDSGLQTLRWAKEAENAYPCRPSGLITV